MAKSQFVSQTQEAVLPRAQCPMCGANVSPARLLLDFDRNECSFAGRKVSLRLKEMRILGLLVKAYPKSVSAKKLGEGVWPSRPPAPSTLRVNIMRMRQRLATAHVAITNARDMSDKHCGRYRLVLPDAETISVMREHDTEQARVDREERRRLAKPVVFRPITSIAEAVDSLTKKD